MKRSHIQHLYWRAGFGLDFNEVSELEKKSTKKVVEKKQEQKKKNTKEDAPVSSEA